MKSKSPAQLKREHLKEWKTFLKNDEDFDWAYIVRVLNYKLKRTRAFFEKQGICSDSEKISKQIKKVEELLTKVENDRYYDNGIKKLEEKYGKRGLRSKSKKIPGTTHYQMTFSSNWDNLPTKKRASVNKSLKALNQRADRQRQADLDKALSIISKNLFSWWD